MDVILAVDLVQDCLARLVRHVGPDFIAPLDGSENLSSLLSIENDWPFRRDDVCIRVGSNAECVALVRGLSNCVEMARVAQVEAAIDVASVTFLVAWLLLDAAVA